MIKALIFDCFGVLVTDALEAIVAEFRTTEPEKADEIVAIIVAANRGMLDPEESRDKVSALLGLTKGEYIHLLRTGEVKNHQLLDYIKTLRPQYKIGLLSNVSSRGLEVRFTPVEFAEHFDAVVASGEIGYAKPEARAYEITADRLGARLEECVMIDDRDDYCEGATSVGMLAIKYLSFEQMRRELGAIIR